MNDRGLSTTSVSLPFPDYPFGLVLRGVKERLRTPRSVESGSENKGGETDGRTDLYAHPQVWGLTMALSSGTPFGP